MMSRCLYYADSQNGFQKDFATGQRSGCISLELLIDHPGKLNYTRSPCASTCHWHSYLCCFCYVYQLVYHCGFRFLEILWCKFEDDTFFGRGLCLRLNTGSWIDIGRPRSLAALVWASWTSSAFRTKRTVRKHRIVAETDCCGSSTGVMSHVGRRATCRTTLFRWAFRICSICLWLLQHVPDMLVHVPCS